ncbi:MAG: tetratricopeptide repeat protein [Paraglaciecola sp.]|uniref:tetratricopeptide repeat protein n=1 Tax=Paraglaciecola sp. TaxID=1920173 RepID=UPI0032976E5A
MVVFRLVLVALITGCAGPVKLSTVKESPELNWESDTFSSVNVPSVESIFYLSNDKKQKFLDYFHAPENQDVQGHKRLSNFIALFLSGFSYKGNTYNADLASTVHAGNCLSLAILTKAYALLAELKIEYRRVNSAPVYVKEDGLITISSHVQTHVHAPKKQNIEKGHFYFSKIVIDYFPSGRGMLGDAVSFDDFISMYYQNLAAIELANKNYDKAYSLLTVAIERSPNNVETLNTLAVLYKKSGNVAKADSIYQYILNHTQGSVSALSNYVLLLKQQGRDNEARVYASRYSEIEDDNPYRWYNLANQAYSLQNYQQALDLFAKTSKMAPYLHESFFGQARAYFQLGDISKAKLAMEKAVELAYTPNEEKLYSAKLHTLKAYVQP